MTRLLALVLAPRAESVARAREAVRGLELPPGTLADAALLVSELVTNAVRHAGLNGTDSISVAAERDDHLFRVEVRDPGAGWHESTPERPGGVGGLGLAVVDAVAARWGTERAEGVTRVWFELDTR